ncbi:MAG TPA: GNAT family N-acetyltransferase [Acidimicrobiales bacterium]|nr:GNAT family N-acetyltransferase [Acidimicrobiales bacterium]
MAVPISADQIQACAAANHVSWFASRARVTGGHAGRDGALDWAVEQTDGVLASILFPAAGGPGGRAALDAAIDRCRDAAGVRSISVWSRTPADPPGLGAWLLARGFGWGWQPHWMAADLGRVPDPLVPDGVHIEVLDAAVDWAVEDLPYYTPATGRLAGLRAAETPRTTWSVAALEGDRPVGHVAAHVGPAGSEAGMYDFGVVPGARRRGIGSALALTALGLAAGAACRWLTLNSTVAGEPVYRRLGFASGGHGQTWWLLGQPLPAPPAAGEIAFIEAVGLGDLDRLEALRVGLDRHDLERRYGCDRTPAQVALLTGRPAAVDWLEANGAVLDVVSAWDTGGRERAAALLGRHPEVTDRTVDGRGATALHVAIERDLPELVDLLLDHGADPQVRDGVWRADAMGWARALGRDHLAAVLDARRGRR